jgi:uncharacterized protein YhaN
MRLRELRLARYGRFTNKVLDFGNATPGRPDLHIVYGPNEAGKSTTLSAFLDLLFGIEMQSRYDFLHPYSTMSIGARLELQGGMRDLQRSKGRGQTLHDPSGQPVPEAVLQADLAGLDRNAYRTMFSLDDETLEEGGNSILASKGELGQLLFSAGAGLAELSLTLEAARIEAAKFWNGRVRDTELRKLKAELEALKERRDALDTRANAFGRLSADHTQAARHYEEAQAELDTTSATLGRTNRLLAALPVLAALRVNEARLAQLLHLPAVPDGWAGELPRLQQAEAEHRRALAVAEAGLEKLAAALAGITPDPDGLAWAAAVADLANLAQRHWPAEEDLPLRRREIAALDTQIATILRRLDRAESDVGRLRLAPRQQAAVEALMDQRSGITAARETAAAELEHARDLLDQARVEAGLGAPDAAVSAAINAALLAWRNGNHAPRLREAARAQARHRDELAIRLQALRPWAGDALALATLTVPDDSLLSLAERHASEHHSRIVALRAEWESARAARDRQQAAHGALAALPGLISDAEAVTLRADREAAWTSHRQRLDGASADAFEAIMRRDDLMAAARLGRERDRAALNEAAKELAIKQAEVERLEQRLAEAEVEQATAAADLASLCAAADPGLRDCDAPRMRSWLTRRTVALETWQALRQAERDEVEAREDEAALLHTLRCALAPAGADIPPEAAPEAVARAAQQWQDADGQQQAARQRLRDAEAEHLRRQQAMLAAEGAERRWVEAWRETCSECWLGEGGREPTPGEVRLLLQEAAKLASDVEARVILLARVRDMEADQEVFRLELHRIAAGLGLACSGDRECQQAVEARTRQARQAEAERQRLSGEEVAAREHLQRIRHAAEADTALAHAMMRAFGVQSLPEVADGLRQVQERAALEAAVADRQRELLLRLGAASLEEAVGELAGQDVAGLEAQRDRLELQRRDFETRAHERFAARQAAADRLEAVGGDDAVARLEEQRLTIMLALEDSAIAYLRLRSGITAAERALRAYRDTHRSSMLREASEAFRRISNGGYRSLDTQPAKDGDRLVAVASDGASKAAVELSKGTRFQLYLALRAAGYREYARHRPAVPFIADDIMETFDDDRAQATLRMLEDLAKLGQVIYLTHHQHLVGIARDVTPAVQVHSLLG